MNKPDFSAIATHIAASYTRRELDQTYYDQLMRLPLMQNLMMLSSKQKHALEFVAYVIAAFATHQQPSSKIRVFLNQILADASSGIMQRLLNNTPNVRPDDLRHIIEVLSDDELTLITNASSKKQPEYKPEEPYQSYLGRLADQVNESRHERREQRKRKN